MLDIGNPDVRFLACFALSFAAGWGCGRFERWWRGCRRGRDEPIPRAVAQTEISVPMPVQTATEAPNAPADPAPVADAVPPEIRAAERALWEREQRLRKFADHIIQVKERWHRLNRQSHPEADYAYEEWEAAKREYGELRKDLAKQKMRLKRIATQSRIEREAALQDLVRANDHDPI